MDAFTIIVFAGLAVVLLVFIAIGVWHPRSATEITDAKRQERWATQATVEEREVPEMIEGQNAYRRARGERELTKADAERMAAERQRRSIDRAEKHQQPA
jgi:hypothetical protein